MDGKSLGEYLEAVPNEFEATFKLGRITQAKDDINNKSHVFEDIRKAIHKHQGTLLNLVGYNTDYKNTENLYNRCSQAINALSELLCEAMVDPSRMLEEYHGGKFLFQR
jgi:fructose-specific component phosphotransferase system IIB-like protein